MVEGRASMPGLEKYILSTTLDVPQVTSIIVENPDPKSPLGRPKVSVKPR